MTTTSLPTPTSSFGYKLRWFSLVPVTTFILVFLGVSLLLMGYQDSHVNLIYTGVSVAQVQLGGLALEEAIPQLEQEWLAGQNTVIRIEDPATGQSWSYKMNELGLTLDAQATAELAFNIGRAGTPSEQWQTRFNGWYYGQKVAPVLKLDQGQIQEVIQTMATAVETAPVDATIAINGDEVNFVPSQVGRVLDREDTYNRLLTAVSQMQPATIELLVHQTTPRVYDASQAAEELQGILSGPMTLYLQAPLDGVDLGRLEISVDDLRSWLRVSLQEDETGSSRYHIFIDEVALRGWLEQYATQIARDPENARFYFDDPTQELVLVEPHVNGRELDIEATITLFNQQVTTPNRSVPLVVKDILPVVHSAVTAQELGITQLVSERTTWFYGSSAERKHNIARAASNFYGLVVAPGEEFSFNKYLGDISLEDGYEEGLIIYGGRTIKGVGGGICQVSTTLYQAVFWGGYDVGSRIEHAYQVGYYNDGEGPGMDATVFSPIVDFTFTNNTEHYLLIENYYNEEFQSLTFKIYSSDIGRRVEKDGPYFENVQQPGPDVWEYNPELAYGVIKQVEWYAEGARVTVNRTVYNFAGEVRDQDTFVSNYIPWGNVYQYGPGVDPDNLPGNWWDLLEENGWEANILE